MKKILFILLFVSSLLYSQENRFEFAVGYGIFYNEFDVLNAIPELDYSTPRIGQTLEFTLDHALGNNKYIGIGYARQTNVSTVNDNVLTSLGVGLVFDNIKLEYENQLYDIHYRKDFTDQLQLSVGLFYLLTFSPNLGFTNLDTQDLFFEFRNAQSRSDDFGLSLSLDYFFPIKDYFEIGIRGRLFYSLVGFEALALTPVVKFSF